MKLKSFYWSYLSVIWADLLLSVAHADNCGSLDDCFPTLTAAAIVAAAVAAAAGIASGMPEGIKKIFNIDQSIKHLNNKALEQSSGYCAYFVREALEAGGTDTSSHPRSAKDYGSFLSEWGFVKVNSTDYSPVKGDIAVIQPYTGGNPNGHIQMYNGELWVSDFKQKVDFWPGGGYRKNKPPFEVYRWSGSTQ
jgi:hypothetical protein